MNSYQQLRLRCLKESTREFNARGKSVIRCEACQLADFACLCAWRPSLHSTVEFVLLMHRDEVFKPTNTGRLIADVLPANTHVFAWSRTDPDTELLQLLADPLRKCFIVFPATESDEREIYSTIPKDDKIATFILLDGTWKQGSRMFHLSRWLDKVPLLALPETLVRSYAVRKSHQDSYLSTLEAGALCLQIVGESFQSETLLDYFALFNHHYLATRGCHAPELNELHQRLAGKYTR